MKLGDFLKLIIGKTVEEIYKVDYNNDTENDDYLPWLFFIKFIGFDKYLEVEGDFDGDHIKMNLFDNTELNKRMGKNNFKDEPDLWQVYKVKENETIGKLINKPIQECEYGVDKEWSIINGNKSKGVKDVFSFVRFYLDKSEVTIFEGGCGLFVSNDPNVKLNLEYTFDKFKVE